MRIPEIDVYNDSHTGKGLCIIPATHPTHFVLTSLQLLRTSYFDWLVDNTTFLVWLGQQMGTCNLAQGGLLTSLAGECLDGMLRNRALVKPIMEACFAKSSEI
jgi:hypothetical protein